MNKEDKELLLKDLCARLPYGVWIERKLKSCKFGAKCMLHAHDIDAIKKEQYDFYKPYLFPLSSITKEHRKKISEILKDININHPPYGLINPNGCDALLTTVTMQGAALIEFYNKYHYDYNNLIPKDLAIDCTNLNIY